MITVVAAVGCGLMAGVLGAFSIAVMPALRRLPAAQGIAAMQAVNVAIVNPLFLLLFLGTAAAGVAAAVVSAGAVSQVAAAALYVLGVLGVTAAVNVPLNNALAAAEPGDAAVWRHYCSRWTAWNHVRALCAAAAAVALTLAG